MTAQDLRCLFNAPRLGASALVLALVASLAACGEDGDEPPPDEQFLEGDDEASEGKVGEAAYDPTQFCLDNGAIPNGPNVGPAALGDTVLGTSGRADGFGNETWGAGYGAELSLRGVSGGPHGAETLIRGELVGSAIVFDIEADVIRIVLDGSSTADGMTGFDADLSVLDRYTYPLFAYQGNFSDEKHFSAPLFTATTGVPLVPGLAPVEVNASALGQLGYLVSGQILPKGIAILVRPEASVVVNARANVGAAGIASARVEGQVELLTISVPIQAALTFDEAEGIKFAWDVRVDVDADWLAGDLEVIASAFGEDRYRKTLADWEGWHLSTTHLSDGAGEIFPGAPGECGASARELGPRILDQLAFAPSTTPLEEPTRAAIDLGFVESPTDEDLQRLAVSFDTGSGEARRAAGHALGRALGRVRELEPDRVSALLEQIERRFDPAAPAEEQILVLQVLGNAGTVEALPVIDAALESDDTSVRIAAAKALRHVPGADGDERLQDVMFGDLEGEVRAAAVRTAGARRTARSDAAIARLAVEESDEWVQIAALHALGRAVTRSDDAAEALRVLAEHARLEQVRSVARNYLHRLEAPVPSIPFSSEENGSPG